MTQSTGNPSITAAEQAYAGLGVRSIINASGSVTRYGGTRTRPEVLQLMTGAARVMVNIDELNRKAGEEIARLTGAEAGLVCSGAAGGLLLQAIACIAGTDPVKMRQLPDTTGMKNEIIIHTMHRFPYDQAYRAAGAQMVEFGDYLYAHPWQLEGAINERTAAVAYSVLAFQQPPGDASGAGVRDRPRQRRSGNRRRRIDVASPGQPAPLPAGRRRHGGVQWRQGCARTTGHRHSVRPREPD